MSTRFSKVLYRHTCTRACMATKTLTITEEAYHLLARGKMEGESFSKELVRVLSKKKARALGEFFGILSDDEGEAMLHDLKRLLAADARLLKERQG